jgi:hypothetical protein
MLGRQGPLHFRVTFQLGLLLSLAMGGCAFGPKALEGTHGKYNCAVKSVTQEQLLLNIVRQRYNDTPVRLDISSIAAQYELNGSAEGRPFSNFQGDSGMFEAFNIVLPFVGVSAANRPTLSLSPADDAETIRRFFQPRTLEGIMLLTRTSWPIDVILRLWLDYINQVPNAPTASGPTREGVPQFAEFQRVAQLLQVLSDQHWITFAEAEKLTELSSPVPAASITAQALIEAARSGYEYQERPDKTWVLIRRELKPVVRVSPAAVNSPEVAELCHLLGLQPGLLHYELTAQGRDPDGLQPPPGACRVNLVTRSAGQVLFYLSHGVLVPPEHLSAGLARTTLETDGQAFDWQQVTGGLFTVHHVKQHCRPEHALVAVKYRDYWFYIDDRDNDTKATFTLMMELVRLDVSDRGKGLAPALTLPLGR